MLTEICFVILGGWSYETTQTNVRDFLCTKWPPY